MCSIELKRDHNETQELCLCSCGHCQASLIRNGRNAVREQLRRSLNIVRVKPVPNISRVLVAVRRT
jgi:hypothetical protein